MRNTVLGIAALALFAGAATAQTNRNLVAVNNLARPLGVNNTLIGFNPTTLPTWNTIGSTSLTGGGAMDYTGFNPQTGAPTTLYAMDTFGTGGLYSIAPDGTSTLIAAGVQGVDDFAYNPADGHMYGISGSALYQFNLNTGAATFMGSYNIAGLETGLAFSSDGRAFIQDLISDSIWVAPAGSFVATVLYTPGFDMNFSQGLFVDWSAGDRGYYGALNNTSFDGELWEFDINGGGITFISNFGPLEPDGLPPVETGDLTAFPIPAPSTLALFGLGIVASRRRR